MKTREKFEEAQKLSAQIKEIEDIGKMQIPLSSEESRKLVADAIKGVLVTLNKKLDDLINED